MAIKNSKIASSESTTATAVIDAPEKTTTSPECPASCLDMDADLIEDIGREAMWLARAAENIFIKLADGNDLSDDELATLRRAGPQVVPRDGGVSARAYERWVHTETQRIKKVRKLQSEAGTGAERQAAIDAAEEAESKFTKRSSEIDSELAKLQAERDDLQHAAAAARAESDRRQTAVTRLREKGNLPAFVVDKMQQDKRRWAGSNGHKLESMRNRLAVLEKLSSLDVTERQMTISGYAGGEDLDRVRSYVEGLESYGRTPNERLAHFGMLHTVERPPYGTMTEIIPGNLNRQKWSAYLEGPVTEEIRELREEITQLEKLEAEHKASLTLADFYVPN